MNELVRTLITKGLGYCCPWAFFHFHKKTALIADRLGVSTRAVQRVKKEVRECGDCEKRPNCLLRKGALKGTRPLR